MPDLATQIRSYIDETAPPLDLDEILSERMGPEPVQPTRLREPVRRLRTPRLRRPIPGWTQAAAVAVVVVLLLGGLVWLTRSDPEVEPAEEPTVTTLADSSPEEPTVTTLAGSSPEEPTVTTLADGSPDEPTIAPVPGFSRGAGGVLGPGAWSVAAAFAEQGVTPEAIASTADVVRAWPGVLEVAEVPDGAAWRRLAGLESDCGAGDVAPPCGSGLVVLTIDSATPETVTRLSVEFGMTALMPINVPRHFVDGYFDAAIETASPVPLKFEPSSLGIEQALSGPFIDPPDDVDGGGDLAVQVQVDGIVAFTGLFTPRVEVFDLLIDHLGRGGAVTDLRGVILGRRAYQFALLPLAAAVITFEQADGTTIWQRPLAGMAVILDSPGTGGRTELQEMVIEPSLRGESGDAGPFHVLDAGGTEIMRIQDTPDGPIIEDLRMARAMTAETEVAPAVADLEVTDVIPIGNLDSPYAGQMVETGDAVWIVEGGSIVRIDAATREVTDSVPIAPIAGDVVDLIWAADAVWAMSWPGDSPMLGTVSRIDAATGQVTDTFEVPITYPSHRGWFLLADGGLWVSHSAGFDRIDLNTLAIDTIDYPLAGARYRTWLGEVDGALWSQNWNGGHGPERLTRIDLTTRQVQNPVLPGFDQRIYVSHPGFEDRNRETTAVLEDNAVWYLAYLDNRVSHLDLESGEFTRITNVGDISGGQAVSQGAFWVAHWSGRLIRIDASTLEVTDTVSIGPSPISGIAVDGDSIWLSHGEDQTLSRVDTAARQLTHVIDLGTDVGQLLALDGAIWVAGNGTVIRIESP